MLFQSGGEPHTGGGLSDEQIVGELFNNFVDTDDPAFLSSPEEHEYEFVTPPLPNGHMSEDHYGVVPLSSGPSPPIASLPSPPIVSLSPTPMISTSNTTTTTTTTTTTSAAELYPRLNKKLRNTVDIERWTPYRPPVRHYYNLYDSTQEEIGSAIDVRTKIDKVDQREHYSPSDEAYILYRQNQFQLDVDMFGNLGNYSSNPPTPSASGSAPATSSNPLYVDVGGMLVPVECLYYHIYAVKQQRGIPVETSTEQESLVDLNQLGGPRNRKDFQLPGLCPIVQGRATYGRLQFRAATPNNARVHPDQPSPNQQYYRIVLSLVAKTATSLNFVFSKISPCFMVRGQNPGKFTPSAPNTAANSKPLSPVTPIPKQEFTPNTYQTPAPYQAQPQQTFDTGSPPQQHFSPTHATLSPNPASYQSGGQSPQPATHSHPLSFNPYTNQQQQQQQLQTQSVNPNPAQLPAIASQPLPHSPNLSRGTKRGGGPGEGEGWVTDGYGKTYTAGKVGINTADPQEALSVQGNILVTGDILKPSDQNIKTNITPLSPNSQLETIDKLKLYEYDLKHSQNPDGTPIRERGVLAQELARAMPSAVRVLKNVTLADGTVMPELLVVQDRALLFENIGATQELSRSVREQRSRLDNLSRSFQHGMHEVRQSTRKAVKAMAHAMSYMLTEKKYDYETSCFFLSIFGLGPAWTMYMLGFFFPLLWFLGIFYIASVVSVKKTAGFVHLLTLIVFVVFAGIVLAWDLDPVTKALTMSAVPILGFIVMVTFGIWWCSKMNQRQLRLSEGIEDLQDDDLSYNSANSVSLLMPPEAFAKAYTPTNYGTVNGNYVPIPSSNTGKGH